MKFINYIIFYLYLIIFRFLIYYFYIIFYSRLSYNKLKNTKIFVNPMYFYFE